MRYQAEDRMELNWYEEEKEKIATQIRAIETKIAKKAGGVGRPRKMTPVKAIGK